MIMLSDAAAKLVRNRPLFIPLMTKYYEAFEADTKTTELRQYGQRWNERTCYKGREAILSKGYGKKHRLTGVIVGNEVSHASLLPCHHTALMECYGTLDIEIILIHIQTPAPRLL